MTPKGVAHNIRIAVIMLNNFRLILQW